MKILGLDPSLTSTGWVIFENNKIIDFGIIKTKKEDKKRFLYIYEELEKIIKKYKIKNIHCETPFSSVSKNIQVGLNLAFVRGLILLLTEKYDIDISNFAPQEIKKQISGNGRAEKDEVAEILCNRFKKDKMFQKIGPFSDKANAYKTSDIYDALAVAICEKEKE